MKLTRIQTSEMHKIRSKFQEIEKMFNEFDDETQEKILDIHNEEHTLQHCIRWGLQATEEILEEVEQ